MMFYVRSWARPLGIEPKVFKNKSEAEIKCNCGGIEGCSPWCSHYLFEFRTELEAWRYIKEMNPMGYKERNCK